MTVAGDLTASFERFIAARLTFDGLSISRAYGTSCGLDALAARCALKNGRRQFEFQIEI